MPVRGSNTSRRAAPAAALDAFIPLGDVAVNPPFAGTYVPFRHYRTDLRVESLMVEVWRDAYLGERAGAPTGGLDRSAAIFCLSVSTTTQPAGPALPRRWWSSNGC
jgi:hypothetical protein